MSERIKLYFDDNDPLGYASFDYPYVRFSVEAEELVYILDNIRERRGFTPFFYSDNPDKIDWGGIYNIWATVNFMTKEIVDIYGEPQTDGRIDMDKYYDLIGYIDKKEGYKDLDEEFYRLYGTTMAQYYMENRESLIY